MFKLSLVLAFLIRGFAAIVMQILLIRELLIVFNGNELSIGIILACWLILEAIGSGVIGRLADKTKHIVASFISLEILLFLLMPLSVYLTRTTRLTFGIMQGEVIPLFPMIAGSLLAMLPIALIDGAMFSFGCKLYSKIKKSAVRHIGRAYILEAKGMIIGALCFTYIFIKFFDSFKIVSILGLLFVVSGFMMYLFSEIKKRWLITGIFSLLLLFTISCQFNSIPEKLHSLSLKKQWDNETVVDYQNSVYGNVAVAKRENQITFFSDGLPIITTPTFDILSVEDLVHFSMLFHPKPDNILVVSSAVGGVINEILKHPVKHIDYAELDPLIIEKVKKFSTPLTKKELSDSRVKINYIDGRRLIQNTKQKYDVVFINTGIPASLEVNRLFTEEFYEETKSILSDDAILIVKAPGSMVYISEGLKNVNGFILKTLKNVFKYVRIIPGDTNIFIASKNLDINQITPDEIFSRLSSRDVKTNLLTQFYINYRMDNYWSNWLSESLDEAKDVRINKDFSASGLFYSLNLFYSLISPKFSKVFTFLSHIRLWQIIILLVLLTFIFVFMQRNKKEKAALPMPLFIGITGTAGIAFQLILLLGFQVIFGVVYFWIGILSCAFMWGLSMGGIFTNEKLNNIKNPIILFVKTEIAFLVFSLALPFSLYGISHLSSIAVSPNLLKALFILLSISAGMMVGLQFPLANKLYWRDENHISKTAGTLYASDLIGASIGGLLISIICIPVLGIIQTCLLIAFLKLASLLIFKFLR